MIKALRVLIDTLRRSWAFAVLVGQAFFRENGLNNSAALTYTTLLALVPLVTIVMAMLSIFPFSEQLAQTIQDYLFEQFVPAAGAQIQQHIMTFTKNASRLSGMSIIFLLIVAISLMASIERVFNDIWSSSERRRSRLHTWLIYWSVLTLGPILMAMSVALTSYVMSLPLVSQATTSGLGQWLLIIMPWFVTTLAFFFLYTVVPNRTVNKRHCLVGALSAALLFEISKRGFVLYLTLFPSYQAIYGVLAAIPITMIWIFLSWVIVILGVYIARTLSAEPGETSAHGVRQVWPFSVVCVLMSALANAQKLGQTRSTKQLQVTLADYNPSWPKIDVLAVLSRLQSLHLIGQNTEHAWYLRKSYHDLNWRACFASEHFYMPAAHDRFWPSNDPELLPLFTASASQTTQILDRPLRIETKKPTDAVGVDE